MPASKNGATKQRAHRHLKPASIVSYTDHDLVKVGFVREYHSLKGNDTRDKSQRATAQDPATITRIPRFTLSLSVELSELLT